MEVTHRLMLGLTIAVKNSRVVAPMKRYVSAYNEVPILVKRCVPEEAESPPEPIRRFDPRRWNSGQEAR